MERDIACCWKLYVTTGKFVYADELKVGEKIAVGTNCDNLSNWNSDEIATGLGETVGGDSFGTDFYYSLRSSIAYAYDIDSSKDTGKATFSKSKKNLENPIDK